MIIDLTPAQYETLLKLVYLGEWMVNGIRAEEERDEKFHQAAQHFYSYADEMGCQSFIEYDKEYKQYVPTDSLDEESEVEKYREEYDDETFWDQLIHNLAQRDFMRLYGESAWFSGALQETSGLQSGFIKKYADEFEANGIANLVIRGDKS